MKHQTASSCLNQVTITQGDRVAANGLTIDTGRLIAFHMGDEKPLWPSRQNYQALTRAAKGGNDPRQWQDFARVMMAVAFLDLNMSLGQVNTDASGAG